MLVGNKKVHNADIATRPKPLVSPINSGKLVWHHGQSVGKGNDASGAVWRGELGDVAVGEGDVSPVVLGDAIARNTQQRITHIYNKNLFKAGEILLNTLEGRARSTPTVNPNVPSAIGISRQPQLMLVGELLVKRFASMQPPLSKAIVLICLSAVEVFDPLFVAVASGRLSQGIERFKIVNEGKRHRAQDVRQKA